MTKYSLELSSGGKRFGEQIEIDTAKGTETFHVPKTSLNESTGDIVYDFKRVNIDVIFCYSRGPFFSVLYFFLWRGVGHKVLTFSLFVFHAASDDGSFAGRKGLLYG